VGLDKTSELEYHIDVLKSIYGVGEATTVAIECTEFCQALADDTRQRILEMLLEKEMCVGDNVVACCGRLIAKFGRKEVCEV
jgi:hypothetical protein